jgi:hypothetical protein
MASEGPGLVAGGRVAARPSRHPAAHSGIACAHAGKQRVSEGGPGHVCTRQTRGGTRPGTRTAHEVPAECASVEAAGARVSARCPPWAASPWRSAARHSRGGRNHGRSAGNGSWPAEMARRHLFPPPGLFLGLFERAKQTDSEGTLREGAATHRQVFYPRRQTRWPAGKSGKLSAGRSPPPPPG